MRVCIGNQEYEGNVARFALQWQHYSKQVATLYESATKYGASYEDSLLYEEAIALTTAYYKLLPEEVKNQLLISKEVVQTDW